MVTPTKSGTIAATVIQHLAEAIKHRAPFICAVRPEVTAETDFDALDLDGEELAALGIGVEGAFSIEISDAELGRWGSVADVVACVEQRLAAERRVA